MAILKANGSILKANGKVLKSVGAKLIYELDINNFDLSTLKDGDVQWTTTISESVTKENNYLRIQPSSFVLSFDQFNLPNNFIVEYTIYFSLSNFQYSSVFYQGVQAGSGGYWSNLGYFFVNQNLTKKDIKHGYQSGSWGEFQRYAGMPYSFPLKVTNKIDLSLKKIECFYNDDQISELVYNENESFPRFNAFVVEPQSGFEYLYSLKIYSE